MTLIQANLYTDYTTSTPRGGGVVLRANGQKKQDTEMSLGVPTTPSSIQQQPKHIILFVFADFKYPPPPPPPKKKIITAVLIKLPQKNTYQIFLPQKIPPKILQSSPSLEIWSTPLGFNRQTNVQEQNSRHKVFISQLNRTRVLGRNWELHF